MKKFFVFCLLINTIFGFNFAQSILLTTPTASSPELLSPPINTVVNNDTVVYCVEDFLSIFEDGKILCINNTASPMDIRVMRYANANSCFASNQYCWTICYNNSTSLSPDPITVGANDSTNAFHGWMTPDGSEGCCYIKYRFFNEDDTTVYAETTIQYCFSHDCSAPDIGIEENSLSWMNMYPNPAEGAFTISFEPLAENGTIKITDQTGRIVRDMIIYPADNNINVTRDGLSTGIYFCNLYRGTKLVSSRKISLK